MPTFDIPESEATGASPGALPSVWPGALAAPSPCSMESIEISERIEEGGDEMGDEWERVMDSLWACCLRNFSLAPEPPGTLDILRSGCWRLVE